MSEKKLSDLGEFGVIQRILHRAGTANHLRKGIGDDCAVQIQSSGWDLLTSTDLLIEGVHFLRSWTSMERLGRKAAAVNISDIAAMGGVPQSLFLGIGCPTAVSLSELDEFVQGFLAEVEHYGAVLAGGDTCRTPGQLFLSVTVQGVVESGCAIYRKGARVGESIYVSGTLGDSALALSHLKQGIPLSPELLDRHHTPKARVDLGRQLCQQKLASAMLDVSDGLLADLGHILESSGVGADLELDVLPMSQEFRDHYLNDGELVDLALAGGEDYELLFTSPRHDLCVCADFPVPVTRVGTIRSGCGITILRSDRSSYHCSRGGFDHFI